MSTLNNDNNEMLEERRRLNDAQAIGSIGSFEWNLGEEAVNWSDEMYRISGLEPQSEVITIERTNRFVHPDDMAEFLAVKQKSFHEPGFYEMQHRILLDNANIKWVAHRFESLANNAGQVIRVHGTLQDITEQKRTEAEILRIKDELALRTNDRYLALFNSIDQGFCVIQVMFDDQDKCIDWRYLDANPVFSKQSGFENAIGKTINNLLPGIEPAWMERYGSVALTGDPIRVEDYVSQIGKWYEVYAFRIDAPEQHHVAVLFNEITERKKEEERQAFLLRFSDTLRAELTVDAIAIRALHMLSEQLRLDRCYVGVYQIADDRGEFPYQVGNHQVPPLPAGVRLSDFPNALRAALDHTLVINDVVKAEGLTGTDRQNLSALGLCALIAATLRRGEHNPLWSIVAVSASPRHWTPGEITLIEEVTERTWAGMERAKGEQALRESEERYRQQLEIEVAQRTSELQANKQLLQTAFDTTVTGLAVFDAIRDHHHNIIDFEFRFLNKEAIKYYGGDLKGKRYTELHPGVKQTDVLEYYVKTVEQNEPQDFEIRYGNEGYYHWFRIVTVKLGDGVLMSYEDITARKQAEVDRLNHLTLLYQSEALASIGSWEYDIVTGRFTWSEGMYSLFELDREREVTPEIYLQLAIDEHKHIAEQVVKSIKGELIPLDETLRLKINGHERVLKIKTTIIKDAQGKPLRSLGVDMDVTATQKAEAKLKEQSHFIRNTNKAIPDVLFVMELETKKIIYINHPLEEKLAYSPIQKESLRNPFFDTMYPEDLPKLMNHLSSIKGAADGEVWEIEYRRVDGQGGLRWYKDRNSVFRRDAQGRVVEKVGITQDITESKKAEQELKDSNTSLRYANENLQQFASIASHDLQEPLRKLNLFASVLKRYHDQLPDEGKELISKISTTSKRMSQLIREVLQYSRIAYGVKEFVFTNLDAILQNVLGDLDLLLLETGAVIQYAEPLPHIDAIPPQMNQLFYNLLTNALKYRKNETKPRIQITCTPLSAGEVKTHPNLKDHQDYINIRFTDNGIGFEQAYAEQIFQLFERLHTTDEFEGTGVGLALCKKIVENHFGDIYAISAQGQGSTFSVLLPVNQ